MHRNEPPLQVNACSTDEARCPCGSLLARWTDSGLELKCRRCKRQVCVPFPAGDSRAPPVAR